MSLRPLTNELHETVPNMSAMRGFLYWLVTTSWFAWLAGLIFSKRPFDRYGTLSVPVNASPHLISGLVFEAYEYSERYLIRKWLPEHHSVIELGASIGVISREILHRIDPLQQLIAVEAVPTLASLAQDNIRSSNSSSRWKLLSAAIAYNAQEVSFFADREHIAGKVYRDQNINSGLCLKIQARTLQSVLSEFSLTDYSLIMDIEGAEHDVLSHDLEALAKCQCLISELHGSNEDKESFCRKLTEIGMTLVERKHSVVAFLRK